VISYPNKSGGTPLWIKCVRARAAPLSACRVVCAARARLTRTHGGKSGVVTQLDAASMQKLSGYGAQSIRTYTAVGGPAVLETALQYGLTGARRRRLEP
jgi:hypothetical protein